MGWANWCPTEWKPKIEGRPPRVVSYAGDGIGPEVINAALEVVDATGANLELTVVDEEREFETRPEASALSDELKSRIDSADAVLFGAVLLRARPVLWHLRLNKGCYANVRPASTFEGVESGSKRTIDAIVLRELSEGLYPGQEGELAEFNRRWPGFVGRMGHRMPDEGFFALRVITENACRRLAARAGRLAQFRKGSGVSPGKVTVVSKANVLVRSEGLFKDVCLEELSKYPDLEVNHVLVDEAARRLVSAPEQFDVILTTNSFGDILSDVASEVAGGLALAPSAALGDGFAYFEPVHGSAPDIAGQGIANPVAAMLSAAMLLEYVGCVDEGKRVTSAVHSTLRDGVCTAELGGNASTASFTRGVCDRL